MEKREFVDWIINWFQEKAGVNNCDLESNFFNSGLLNSFTTLELVMDIESSLKLSLPDSALSDPRFSTINGLASILSELSGAGVSHVK